MKIKKMVFGSKNKNDKAEECTGLVTENKDDGDFGRKKIIINSTIGPDRTVYADEYETEMRNYAEKMIEVDKKEEKNPRKRTLQLLYNVYNQEIMSMIYGEKRELVPGLNKIIVTQEAFNKAGLIAKRTLDLTGGANEVYMHLLDCKEKRQIDNLMIRDVYILRGQKISPTSCGEPSIKGEADSLIDISHQGKIVAGWAHSHGNLSTFHSSTDKTNLDKAVSTFGTKIYITPKPFKCSNTEFIVRYIPSMVVNSKNDNPSCAIGIEYPQLELNNFFTRNFYLNENPQLEIREESNGIEMRQEMIDREILERADWEGKGRKIVIMEPEKQKDTTEEESELRALSNINERNVPTKDYISLLKDYFRMVRGIELYEKRIDLLEVGLKKHETRIRDLESLVDERKKE